MYPQLGHECTAPRGFCYPAPMDYLWTPWRYAYVSGADPATGCIFCNAPKESDEKARIVHRGTHCYVILNTYPYTNGHVMIVPYAHLDELQRASRRGRPRNDGPQPAHGRRAARALSSRRHQPRHESRARPPAPASPDTSTCTSCPAGWPTQTSSASLARRGCCRKRWK